MSYANFSTTSLFEYLPTRYQATCEQQRNRREVYDFKDGYCSDRVYNGLKDKILSIVNGNSGGWVIAFIPGSTSLRTRIKYHNLAKRLAKDINVEVCEDAIVNTCDRQSTMVTGKVSNPTSTFSITTSRIFGKKVILIDDVITTGSSFRNCASRLMASGATSVHGLFVARTINPDWN